ncbi:MAG: entericidin A/B family lipoprotein [Ahniella sp.]|nr:entericidin A/B family lipoprotein [Ahniella sp.]
MNISARKTTTFLMLGLLALGLTACNTMRGLGKDTEDAGEKIQEEAEERGADEATQP